MTTDSIGLYLHVPFCKRKCNYCDFCSFSNLSCDIRDRYIDRLVEEIGAYKRDKKIGVDTIFFGGGTPTLLTPFELEKIIRAIDDTFRVAADCEFTLEGNPGTVHSDNVLAYKSLGVNRFSLGLQSIHENELKILGRIHNYDDFLNSYNTIYSSGITNINVDLMYGIPEQTTSSFEKTLIEITRLSPTHISAYGLILEEGTPFFDKRNSLALPPEDSECDMYYTAAEILGSNGYSHYEISNYHKAGYACRHNLKYWHADEYIGVGISAYSYFGGARYGNSRDMDEYLSSHGINYTMKDVVDAETRMFEYAMMRLRLREGFSLSEYESRFGTSLLLGKEEKVKELIAGGYLNISDDRIALTERGFYVSNTILTELL